MNLLEFFMPTHHFKYQTLLQIEKVKMNLQNSLNPTNEIVSRLSSTKKIKLYEGQVSEKEFVITRRDKENTHIFPIAQGVINSTKNGSEIIGKVTHTKNVQRITLFSFILFIITLILALLFRFILFDEKLATMTATLGTAPLFIFLIYYFICKPRAKKLEKEIIEIIEEHKT